MVEYNIQEVTFANFIDIFKNLHPFNLDYTKIAHDIFDVEERTLLRWRNGKYGPVMKKNYDPLFKYFENTILEDNERVLFLVDAFRMPRHYGNLEYSDLKEIIIHTLNNKLLGMNDNTQPTTNMASVESTKDFLLGCLDKRMSIKCISMAFHSGWYWWDDHEMTKLLKLIDSKGIEIRVIANPESTINQIAMAMRNPELVDFYLGFDETLAKWHTWEKRLENLNFRVCEYPLFRKIIIVEYVDGTKEALFRDYVYDYSHNINEPKMKLTIRDASFDIFQREYEFLWRKSIKYLSWYSSQPPKEKNMEKGNYLFFQLSHNVGSDDSGKDFVVSGLSIEDNNKATLFVNVMDSNKPFIRDNAEYVYTGTVHMTGNVVYMNLIDDERQEQVNISLRTFKGKERFIGIATGLSTGYQPVAFKCACLSQSLLSKIDFQKLKEVLSHHNREWGNNLMILEERDIDLFYSNRILKREIENV